MAVETTVNLDQFETQTALELLARGAGTYRAKMMVRGNSLLSSVYIKSASPGATLKVNYFDTTSGDESTGERFDLTSHALLTDANVGQTHRIVVSRLHNKPQIEAIVTSGTVEFGVYVTAVADFPVSFDGASVAIEGPVTVTGTVALSDSKLNASTVELGTDKGLPVLTYDPSDGKFYLLRSTGGVLRTTVDDNVRQEILRAADRIQSLTYADFGTIDQRVVQIDYVSPTVHVGVTARKTFTYTNVSGRYRRDTITWTIV